MAEEQTQPTEKKDMSKLGTHLFLVLNLLVMLGGSFVVYTSTLGYETPVTGEAELNKELNELKKQLMADTDVLYSMDSIITNLYGVPKRTVKVDLSLEMVDAEGFEEIIAVNAEARDKVMSILNTSRFNDIETVQGKLKLKNKIIAGVNTFLDKGVVKNVYFTDLVVQ